MIALLPAALAALFAFACGSLWGGAGSAGAVLGQGALLAFALVGAREAADPWRLGKRLAWLPWVVCAAVAVSVACSPVPRAGRVVLCLAPAFVLAVPATARCFASERGREQGTLALILMANAVAITGLFDLVQGGGRAARPLGHHQLLAAFLVAFLPLVLLLLGRRQPWRALAIVSTLAVGGAIVASGSLLGLLAMAVAAALVAVASRRAWRLVLGFALLAGAAAMPRLEQVWSGQDPSTLARGGYLAAGWRGILERPIVGWGPGSTPWTVARHLRPAPSLRPAGELVGDLHSAPAELLYELGLTGATLFVATLAAFAWRRSRRGATDRYLRRAAGAGLVGLGGVALGNGALAVTAVPLAAALLAGVAMAAEGAPSPPTGSGRRVAWVARLGLLAAACALAPLGLAERAYERAAAAAGADEARVALDRAVALDPQFPLYRARRAWLDRRSDPTAAAEAARAAAVDASDVAPLWLAAGVAGREAGATWALAALATACELDPMGPIAPFQLAMAAPDHARAAEWMARAIASEPGLLAAVFWESHEPLLDRSLRRIESDGRLELGYRAELLERARQVGRGQGGLAELGVTYDGRGETAGSLYLFRRRPWRTQIGGIEVRKGQIGKLALPSASQLPTTAAEFFAPAGCRP